MKLSFRIALAGALLVALAGCSSVSKALEEPTTLIGEENDVRLRAQVFLSDSLANNSGFRIVYDIENQRTEPIAIAHMVPDTVYDVASQTITISLGAEVPGNDLVPRLVKLGAGEKKEFSTSARTDYLIRNSQTARPRYLRIKLNYLDSVKPFEQLIDIPEVSVHDAELANELFVPWVEHNVSVATNTMPIYWRAKDPFNEETPGRR